MSENILLRFIDRLVLNKYFKNYVRVKKHESTTAKPIYITLLINNNLSIFEGLKQFCNNDK